MLKKIWLLFWKNLVLRKRHWFVTTLEILLPLLLFALLAYSKAKLGDSGHSSTHFSTLTVFNVKDETDLKKSFTSELRWCDPCIVAYSPENSQTRQVIQKLQSCLNHPEKTEWKPFNNEDAIETYVTSLATNSTNRWNNIQAAIVFEDGMGFGNGGTTISYKIRLMEAFNSLPNVRLLFPTFQQPGPDQFNEGRYAGSGFIGLQLCIDKSLTEVLTGKTSTRQISLQAFPYPPYEVTKNFNEIYFKALPIAFLVSFVFMVPSIMRAVVSEKQTGIRELLKLNGLRGWMQWVGWMLNSMVVLVISVTIVVILLFTKFGTSAIFQYSDPTVWWFVLMLYIMSATSFCFFICSFFTKPSLATTLGIILWFTSIYPNTELTEKYDRFSLGTKMTFALIPNTALTLAIRVMSSFEAKAAGIQWSNIGVPINRVDSLCLGHVILMFFVNTFLYMFLTLYLENVLPSKFGVRKPWYYLFQPSTYFKSKSVLVETDIGLNEVTGSCNNAPGFEKETNSSPIGVEIINLRKDFGGHKVAVDGLNMKMYEGEIFALLGHNGAGKTTTISMLTGMFAPSSGTAKVNGHDITTALDKARDSLGLCPQHNMLFDKLTVWEHLIFFGQLKGLSSSAASNEATMLLPKLQLADKAKTISSALSGGQMRKLSLGIALMGGSKVVILDEPTSGMDPEARRVIWDLLLEMRGQRTILLTTHFMEEADVLGDRLGIMTSGKLSCCGSSAFLKRFYGTGYTLKISFKDRANAYSDNILPLIQTHVSNATVKAVHSTLASDIMITLPTETATTLVLSEMFSDLTKHKDELGIKSVGLSLTTMDEVFLRVGELSGDSSTDDPNSNNNDEEGASEEFLIDTENTKVEKHVGLKLVMEQMIALIIKKCLYSYRNVRLIIAQLIIPVIFLSLAILASNSLTNMDDEPPPLKITLKSYNNLVTLGSSTNPYISSQLSSVIGPSYKQVSPDTTLSQALLKVGDETLAAYRERYIVAFDLNYSNINAMFNTIPNHAAPLAINLASNFLLKTLEPNRDFTIQVINHPIVNKVNAHRNAASRSDSAYSVIPIIFGILMPIGLGLLAASFIVFPIEEKICKAKQLQMMTGVSPLIYWGSSFIWDFVLLFVAVCVMTLCFPIFQSNNLFTSYGGAGAAFLIFLVYGLSAVSFSYLVSRFAETVSGGFSLVSIIHIISGVVLSLITFSLEAARLDELLIPTIVRWIGRLFPTFGASISTMRFSALAFKNARCNILSDETKKFLCDPSNTNEDPAYRQCCANCGQLPGVTCFKPQPYITWSFEKTVFGDTYILSGVGQELLIMVIMGFVYYAILMLLEYRVLQRFFSKDNTLFVADVTDDDVYAEVNRVTDMIKSGKTDEDALVVENLCKSYGSFAAVSKLNFGVHHGECFGLLGVNGAGKTTTFRMLTGDESRSDGNAYMLMNTLDKNRQQFLSNIGYCPQFDGIIGVLTGRQMLELFGRLRGVPRNVGGLEADKWLEKMGLSESANVQCGKYSGGMKRRLSVSMAMIGEPQILLLDEPTSGVDPVARRRFWDVLRCVRDTGQSIILTSHSMEECEALCSRLGIIINGQLQCLGGVQHLKNKFAQGYMLSIKLKPLVPSGSEEFASLKNAIGVKFHPCTLKDVHQNVCQYQLHNTSLAWDVCFKTMEDLKGAFETVIEDYSLNETSLEEVFLSFARKQYGERKAEETLLKRCLTCNCW